jgi:CheY-like chemotaxis protein
VAEDHAINQLFVREILENVGVVVTMASTGREAVQAVATAARPFAAVLMDIQMPEMDGYGATAAIRALTGSTKLPIIAMTAHALAEDRERCLQAGMDDYVSKPIDVMQLYAVLLRHLGHTVTPGGKKRRPRTQLASPHLPDVPGINLPAALGRMAGNTELLILLINSFAKDKSDFPAEMRAIAAAGRWDDGVIKAHGLKGVAGNIGAEAVQAVAGQLEAACEKQDRAQVERLLPELAERLDEIKTAAQLFTDTALQPVTVAEPPVIQLEHVVSELTHLLRIQDLQAIQAFNRLRDLLAPGSQRQAVLAVGERVSRLDFKGALALVDRLATSLGIGTTSEDL